MKVKLRTQYAGPRGVFAAGSVADFGKAEAYGLIEGGYAEQIPEPAKERGSKPLVETADLLSPETAEAAANRRRMRP